MQDRPASAFVQDCITPLEPTHRNPKTHGRRNTRRTNCEKQHPNAKTPAQQQQQQQQSTHSKQAPSTKTSIRVYQSTGVSEHSRAPTRTKDDEGWPKNRQQHSSPHSRAHKQFPTTAAMFAEVIVPGKKKKRTRYCSLQELGLVMCARTVGLYATCLLYTSPSPRD